MHFEKKYLWELSVYAAQHLEKKKKKHAKTPQSVLTDTFNERWPSNPLLGDQWECARIQKLFSSGKIKQSSLDSHYQGV